MTWAEQVRAEVEAMNVIADAVLPLDAASRGRVVRWVIERFLGEYGEQPRPVDELAARRERASE